MAANQVDNVAADWSRWIQHNNQDHGGPRGGPRPRQDEPPWCPTCADLAPVRTLAVYHHTDDETADAIVTSQGFQPDGEGRIYFTTAETLPDRVPGIMPQRRGAVVRCTLPVGALRLDRAFLDELCVWVHETALEGVILSREPATP